MPAILTEAPERETWLAAPWSDAKVLQRPLPDGTLRIVARGEKEDTRRHSGGLAQRKVEQAPSLLEALQRAHSGYSDSVVVQCSITLILEVRGKELADATEGCRP